METPKLQDYIHTLYDELEMDPKPTANEKLQYKLVIADDLELFIQEFDDHAFIEANIKECPQQKREELFMYLMEANLLGQGTGESAIGLDQQEKFLTLSSILSYDTNYAEFKNTIEDFTNYLFYWREEVEKFEKKINQAIL
jgi:hypothetical protein